MLPVEAVASNINEQAQKLYYEQKYSQAMVLFNRYLQSNSNDVGALKLYAHCKVILGYASSSIDILNKAIQLNNKDADLFWVRAIAAHNLNDWQGVITYSQAGLSCKPEKEMKTRLTTLMGEAKTKLKQLKDNAYNSYKQFKYPEALKLYNEYLLFVLDDADALRFRGDVQKWQGDPASCIIDCDESIRLQPNNWVTLFIRARALIDQEKLNEALADLEKAFALNLQSAEIYAARGIVYEKLNDLPKAIANFQKALQIDAKESVAIDGIKRIQAIQQKLRDQIDEIYKKGKYAEAKKMYEDHLKKFPDDIAAKILLADSKKWLGDADGCINDCSECLRLQPKKVETYFIRARAKIDKKDLNGAMEDIAEAITVSTKEAYIYYFRGYLYEKMNDYEKAIKDYEQVLLLDPNYEHAKECAEKIRKKQIELDYIHRKKIENELKQERLLKQKTELEIKLNELSYELDKINKDKLQEIFKRFKALEESAHQLKQTEFYKLRAKYFEIALSLVNNKYQQEAFYRNAKSDYEQILNFNPNDMETVNKLLELESNLKQLQAGTATKFFQLSTTIEERVTTVPAAEENRRTGTDANEPITQLVQAEKSVDNRKEDVKQLAENKSNEHACASCKSSIADVILFRFNI